MDPEYLTGALTVTIQKSISGTDPNAPDAGQILVTAQDGSYLTMTLSGGNVTLEVDTDNDGTVDGTLSVNWDDL